MSRNGFGLICLWSICISKGAFANRLFSELPGSLVVSLGQAAQACPTLMALGVPVQDEVKVTDGYGSPLLGQNEGKHQETSRDWIKQGPQKISDFFYVLQSCVACKTL